MRKIVVWISLAVVVTMMIVSCAKSTDISYEAIDFDYSLKCKGDYHYLSFDDPQKYPSIQGEEISISISESIDFDNMDDFYNTVTKGLLNNTQKRHINTVFLKDSEGNIQICDFNSLYDLEVPSRYKICEIGWKGYTYSFRFDIGGNGYGTARLFQSEDDYDQIFRKEYTDELAEPGRNWIKTTEFKDGKEYDCYMTADGTYMNECYTLMQGEKTMVVKKYYRFESAANPELESLSPLFRCSNTIPASIKLFCTEGNKQMIVTIYVPPVDLSDEELLQFELVPYAPKEK